MHCELSRETTVYVDTFDKIFEEMIIGMTTAKLADSISYNFIVQMIPHHRGAIEMSKNILQYTDNRTLRRIASGIISEQTKSIANMRRIQEGCLAQKNCECELQSYEQEMDDIMQSMFSQMGSALTTNNVNCNFLREMIPHHEGAVLMSETTLRYQICPQLVPILRAIITSQKRGIQQMHQLESQLRCIR